MTIQEALSGITNYPIPQRTFNMVAGRRGLDLQAEATQDVMNSGEYRKAEADINAWLATSPTFTEGGVSFSFSQAERDAFRREAAKIYSENGAKPKYGYQGEDL